VTPKLLGSKRLRLEGVLNELAQADSLVLEHVAVNEHLDVQAREELADVGLKVGGVDLCKARRRSVVRYR
jgi:hypothetical protein